MPSSSPLSRSFSEFSSNSRIGISIVIFILLVLVAKLLYNIYFHPLAKFPGPKLAAATDLVYWYHWYTGNVHKYTESIHAQYGEVVRVTPYRLSFINPQAWKDIYGHKTASKKGHLHKEPSFYQPDYNGRDSILTNIDDQAHSRVRKVFTNAFSDRALKAQESLIHTHVDKFINIIRRNATEKPGLPIDTVKLLNCLTFDVIGDLAFGESLGLLETAEYNDWLRTVFGSIRTLATTTFLFEYPILGAIASLFVPKSIKEAQKMVFEFASTRVEKRMEKGAVTEKPDIWSLALAQHDKGALDIEDMKANANLFMVAGSETTATFLSGFLYNMLMSPVKMEKLVAEVRSSFRSEDELTIENIQALKYLAACFDESLRLYPPVPQGPPRVMDAEGGVISGHFIPANTRLSLAQYTAYHSPVNFKDPLSFIPERWIADDPAAAEFENDRKAVLQPFSYGPRNCIGKNLALHEMRLTATKLLWNFDIELCSESKDTWHEQRMFWGLWEKPPLWLKFKVVKRDPSC